MSRVELVYFRGSEDERKLMRCAYAMLEREGSARRMFMDGTVRSAEEFEKDLFRPGSLPFLVLHDGQPCGVSWLNTLEGRAARGHYAVFRRYWGRKMSVTIGRSIFEHYLGLRDERGYLFDVLIGIAPVGGLVSLPFYATLMALFQAATGDDDDWTEAIRKQLPQNTMLRDIVCYGLPAGAGVNLGGSLKMELALTGGMQKGGTPKEVLTEGIGDIIGIPWDMFVERPSKVMEAMRADNYWRAVEEVVPTAVSNGMKAWRLATEGQKTLKGRDINDPGERGARRLSSGEALGKLLGFQPVSATRSYDAYAASRHSDSVRADKADEVATIMVKALDAGDSAEMVRARKVLKDWNAKMEKEGKPHMRILMKDVQKRVTQRRRQARLTPKARQKGEAFQSVWG